MLGMSWNEMSSVEKYNWGAYYLMGTFCPTLPYRSEDKVNISSLSRVLPLGDVEGVRTNGWLFSKGFPFG